LKGGDQANESKETEDSDKAEKAKVVESGGAAIDGASGKVAGSQTTVDDLPEVPKAEPSTGDGPEPKRQKQEPSDP
jgi:hypothetical protein